MAKDQEVDRSVAQAEETIRKGEELARQVSQMQEETNGMLRQYGINPDKVSAFLASGQMTPEQRKAVEAEKARFQAELERDTAAAEEAFRRSSMKGAAKPAARPRVRRSMV